MPTNSYDLIVIGDDLAGLSCAALCARRGLRTLVIGRDDQPARYTLGPFKLPVEPGVLVGRGAGGAARVVRELGLDHALKRRVRELRTATQLVGPDLRMDLGNDTALQTRELERELGKAGAAAALAAWDGATAVARAADALLDGEDAFPGVGFFERRDAVKQAARAAEAAQTWWAGVESAPAPIAALTRVAAAVGGRAVDPPPIAIARALDLWRQGAPPLRGDGTGMRELLLEKLTAANGEVRTGTVTELVQGWTKINAVRLGTEELGAAQVVASMPLSEVVALLGKKPPRRLVELAEAQRRVGWRYVLNLVIDAAAVPEGMAPTALVYGDGALAGASGFSIHAGEADDQGRVVVTVATVLPAGDDEAAGDGPDAKVLQRRAGELRAKLLEAVEQVMPFCLDHLVVAHSPHEATAPLAGGRGTYELGRGLPAAMPSVWRGTLEGAAGLAAATYATGVKNLTLASSQVLPVLGLEGDLVCGWNAARVACNIAGKKRDYLRDEVVNA